MMPSPSGNRTLVSRVTGGDTDHYTNEDLLLKTGGKTDKLTNLLEVLRV